MNCSTFGKIFLAATVPLCLSAGVVHAAGLETLTIKKQTSHYMSMGQTIKRIAVGNPEIATVVQLPGSASEFLVVTKAVDGSTALFVWTADGARHEYLIIVSPEDPGRAMLIEQAINLPDVHVKMVGERILLTGTVENQYEKNYALQTARLFIDGNTESSLLVGSGFDMELKTNAAKNVGRSETLDATKSEAKGRIIDLLQILHPTQIRLEAQIIEINSDDAKNLGLRYGTDPSGSPGIFSFGEDYARTNTQISESFSNSGSNSRSGSWSSNGSRSFSGNSSNSYDNSNSSSYSGSNTDSSDDYSNAYNNGYSNSNTGSGSRSRSRSGGSSFNRSSSFNRDSSFSRSVTSTWYDMVQFANNPLKWIGQHFAPINAQLSLLVTKGKAKILSRPSVMTLSGEQATIQIGGEIPYSTYDSDGKRTTEFKDYGIILQFRPVVDAQNRINSAVHAEVSQPDGETPDGQITLMTRTADSVISLNSGAPIVIGGLIDSTERKTVEKIPLLGDIPIIGEFFKHTSKSRDKMELIIVVTPYLVGSEEEVSRSPMSEAMRQWYEQEQKYVDAMESFDFKTNKPVADETADDEQEEQRILPPPKYPNDKTTDKPFKN